MLLSNPEEAYKILDTDYKEKRFVDLENFKKFIENNKDEITKLSFSQFSVNIYDDYQEYICKDQYNNIYNFIVTSPTKYTVKLDTYTILTDKFKENYDNSKTQEKVMLNVNKWILMLNNRDYTAAYDVLDQTFRNNEFGSEENFEKYMRQKYPLHYTVSYGEYKEENGIQIQSIQLKDITNENKDVLDMKIIMKLNDEYNFVMSFEK